jgi:hypothetical protein
LADFSITVPVAEISCPAPAVVWQAVRSGTMATSESVTKPMMSLLYMLEAFQRVSVTGRAQKRVYRNSRF